MPGRPRATAALLCLALAASARASTAQPHPPEFVRLEVTRDARSARCPDGPALRALLQQRLRRDAVRDDAVSVAYLRFTRERTSHVATLRLRRAGLRPTVRRIPSPDDDCARVADAAVLVLALAIDPLRATYPPSPVEPPPPPVEPPPPPVPVEPPPAPVEPPPPARVVSNPARPRPAPPTPSLQLAALATLSTGVAPGLLGDDLRPGLALRVTPLAGAWAFPVELSADAPGRFDDTVRDARVDVLLVRLGAGACRRFGRRVVVPVCAVTSVDLVVAWGVGYVPDRTDATLALGFGARAGVEVPLRGRWWFVASAELRGLAIRPALQVDGTAGGPLWTSAPVAATLGIGVAWSNR